jgi:hypothetical protein
MKIPGFIIAGDTVQWQDNAFTDTLGNLVTSSVYTLTYSFRGPIANAAVDLAGAASGTGWQFTLSAAQTGAFNTGAATARWYWQAAATAGSTRITAGGGQLVVRPNLVAISGQTFDGRSQAEQDLAAVEAAIRARMAGTAVQEYTVGIRNVKYMSITDLHAERSRLQIVVRNERRAQAIANGLGAPDRVAIRFTPS